MPTGTLLQEFSRVTPDVPCPICGKDDWCMISHDGFTALCCRIESHRPFGNAGWAHLLTTRHVPPPPENVERRLSPHEIERRVMKAIANCTRRRLAGLAAELGVSPRSLERLGVGWNRRLECYTFPMRDAKFRHVGIRYRFPDGSKRSIKGGGSGLFLPMSSIGARSLFVAEGPTDAAALLDCRFPAIGRPNNLGGIDLIVEIAARFRPQTVVIVDDADKAGALGGFRLAQSLAAHAPYNVQIKRIRPAQHKDAREAIRAGGGRQSIIGALDQKSNRFWEPSA